jgi:autotransporter-associated beta strand protein
LTLSGVDTYTGGTMVNDGTLIVTSPLAIADGTNLSIGDPSLFASADHTTLASSMPLAASPVPEPGTLVLLAAGAALLAMYCRRR